MRMEYARIKARQRINLTLDPAVIAEAKDLGLNLSQECEAGLSAAVKREADRRWQSENAEWIKAHHDWVEANELPLERYRLF